MFTVEPPTRGHHLKTLLYVEVVNVNKQYQWKSTFHIITHYCVHDFNTLLGFICPINTVPINTFDGTNLNSAYIPRKLSSEAQPSSINTGLNTTVTVHVRRYASADTNYDNSLGVDKAT